MLAPDAVWDPVVVYEIVMDTVIAKLPGGQWQFEDHKSREKLKNETNTEKQY